MYHQIKKGCKNVILPNLSDFLNYFKNAEYVFTDSFHGLVFSLIFKRKCGVTLPHNFSNRITSLLELVNGKDFIISDFKNWEKVIDYVDMDEIYNNLIEQRNCKLKILSKYLDKKR